MSKAGLCKRKPSTSPTHPQDVAADVAHILARGLAPPDTAAAAAGEAAAGDSAVVAARPALVAVFEAFGAFGQRDAATTALDSFRAFKLAREAGLLAPGAGLNPQQFDVLFEMRPHIRRDFKKNKIVKQYYYEYSAMNNTMGVMLLNMVKYLFCINRNFRSDKPAPGQLPRLGHLEFKDVPQSDPFIKVHEVNNTKNFMNQEAETRSFDQISKHEYMGVDEN